MRQGPRGGPAEVHPYRDHRLGGIRGARLCGDDLLERKRQWVACWGAVGSGGPEPEMGEDLPCLPPACAFPHVDRCPAQAGR
jgi:hypothetical protein